MAPVSGNEREMYLQGAALLLTITMLSRKKDWCSPLHRGGPVGKAEHCSAERAGRPVTRPVCSQTRLPFLTQVWFILALFAAFGLCGCAEQQAAGYNPNPAFLHEGRDFGVAMIGQFLYTFGGIDGKFHLSCSMHLRSFHRAAMLQGLCPRATSRVPRLHKQERHAEAQLPRTCMVLIRIGDFADRSCRNSLHVFSGRTREWKEIPTDPQLRPSPRTCAMAACGAHLFVFGGENGQRPTRPMHMPGPCGES